jgi:hypothetical protein
MMRASPIFAGRFALTAIVWIALSPGLIDPNGKPDRNRLDKPERPRVPAQIEKPVFTASRKNLCHHGERNRV